MTPDRGDRCDARGDDPIAVLAVVGTDTHPFERLVAWLERWHAQRPDQPRILVQHGHTRPPRGPAGVPFLGHDELRQIMSAAAVVVSHGGPATITDARRAGRMPIVVPRDPGYGEHVDSHQLLFARRMARERLIRLCETEEQLVAMLDKGLSNPSDLRLDSDSSAQARRDAAVARAGLILDDMIAALSRRRNDAPPR